MHAKPMNFFPKKLPTENDQNFPWEDPHLD
jgi:hypothetical protein